MRLTLITNVRMTNVIGENNKQEHRTLGQNLLT